MSAARGKPHRCGAHGHTDRVGGSRQVRADGTAGSRVRRSRVSGYRGELVPVRSHDDPYAAAGNRGALPRRPLCASPSRAASSGGRAGRGLLVRRDPTAAGVDRMVSVASEAGRAARVQRAASCPCPRCRAGEDKAHPAPAAAGVTAAVHHRFWIAVRKRRRRPRDRSAAGRDVTIG